MIAAGATEPDRAGTAAGLDVGGFGAGAVRNSDLSDRVSGVLGLQERVGVAPDTAAVPVETHRGHLVDSVAAPFLSN